MKSDPRPQPESDGISDEPEKVHWLCQWFQRKSDSKKSDRSSTLRMKRLLDRLVDDSLIQRVSNVFNDSSSAIKRFAEETGLTSLSFPEFVDMMLTHYCISEGIAKLAQMD